MNARKFGLSAVLIAATLVPVGAQSPNGTSMHGAPAYAPVPFGIGERITYKLSVGAFGQVGRGSMEVRGTEVVRGEQTYQLDMQFKGRVAFASVDNKYSSWLDVDELISHRFHSDVHEVNYQRDRLVDFYPSEKRWIRTNKPSERGSMPTAQPLDDLSFIYYVRTLPLEIGKTYTMPRYWKDEGNPVTVKVLRRETISVTAGQFRTIVLQPIIRTDGIFSEGGKAEIYLTDDDRRIPVYIKMSLSKIPLLRTINMQMDTYAAGRRVAPPLKLRDETN